MVALSYESAKNLGIAVAIGLVVLMVLSAWLIKNVTVKLVMILVMGGLALLVWTQRSSLQDCADKVAARESVGDTSTLTCSFLGTDITVFD